MNPCDFEQPSIPTKQPSVSSPKASKKNDVFSIISLVFGLISGCSIFTCWWLLGLYYLCAFGLGMEAIALGILALVRGTAHPKRTIIGLFSGMVGILWISILFQVSMRNFPLGTYFRWIADLYWYGF